MSLVWSISLQLYLHYTKCVPSDINILSYYICGMSYYRCGQYCRYVGVLYVLVQKLRWKG